MDESELEIQETEELCKPTSVRKCEACKIIHVCERCIRNMHICAKCGKMSHDCDICGTSMNSLAEIKKHQRESKICKKARMLTARSFEEQLIKAGIKVSKRHRRTSSVPIIISIGVIS